MGFYESDRIIRKQQKFEKSRAYTIISDMEHQGLDNSSILNCLEILLNEDNTELRAATLKLAMQIVTHRMEIENGKEVIRPIVDDATSV